MSGLALSPSVARDRLGALAEGRDDEAVVGAYARAVWSVLTEPGDRVAGALVGTVGAAAALHTVGSARFGTRALEDAGVSPEEVAAGRRRWWSRLDGAEIALANARRAGAALVVPGDDAWPPRADDLGPFAPLCLWIRGDRSALGAPHAAVAVVGARAATGYGEHVAGELAAEAAGGDVVVYSGGAYGIDAAAHRAVLAVGGTTVAVMAGGIERPYPAGHADLLSRIAATGVVVAEVACGTAPTRHRFLARNRLIAALSDVTVVVEAGWRSGALNTAHHAQALGRPVGVVPGPITSAASAGCHRLLREGEAVCVTGFGDVRELLGVPADPEVRPASPSDAGPHGPTDDRGHTDDDRRTDDRTRILDALSVRAGRSVEDVARRAGFAPDEAAALLGILELEGRAARRSNGWTRPARPAADRPGLW